MNTSLAECASLTKAIREKTGTTVGIAVERGMFAVTETRKVGRTYSTSRLTNWQSHEECVQRMRLMAKA